MENIVIFLFMIWFLISESAYPQSDCVTAIDICDDSDITVYPDGIGIRDFNCSPIQGCMSGLENASIWLRVNFITDGDFVFTITPRGIVDVDFAIWSSDVGCSNLNIPNAFCYGSFVKRPIRCTIATTAPFSTSCSDSTTGGSIDGDCYSTGLSYSATDTSESHNPLSTRSYLKYLSVKANQSYLVYIDGAWVVILYH